MTTLVRCCALILVKPDAVSRKLVGAILGRFEQTGLEILYLDVRKANKDILDQHYQHLVHKDYYSDIVHTMTMGSLVVCVVAGWAQRPKDFYDKIRNMLGATDPLLARPGTIRGDYAMHVGRNVCHASENIEEARREIKLWTDCNFNETSKPDYLIYREK